ncbi:carbon-nitrogen hydrolase [Bacillaceae bacterium]
MEALQKIAVVQAAFAAGDVSYNLQRMRAFVRACKERHPTVKLVLFPELAATGYFLSPHLRACAEKKDGPIFREMSAVARENGVYVGYGYAEKEEAAEQKMYNSFALLDDEGNLAAHYRKIHLTALERDLFAPGREFVTADTPLGKVGLLICWDLAFPEAARKLALRGAELLLAPSAWERPHEDAYLRFGMARALDNTVFLATCNHVGRSVGGTGGELHFFGDSRIFAPDGSILAHMEQDAEGILVGEISLSKREELKRSFYTMLEERRTDLYGQDIS